MEEMFESFEKLEMNDFSELTTSLIPWLEENCNSHLLKQIANRTLQNLVNGMENQNIGENSMQLN